jgi:hypothetical protein
VVLARELDERGERLDVHAFDDGRGQRARRVDRHDVAAVLAQHGDGDVEVERWTHALQDELEEVYRSERALGIAGGVARALREEHRRRDYTRGPGSLYRRFPDARRGYRNGHKARRADASSGVGLGIRVLVRAECGVRAASIRTPRM